MSAPPEDPPQDPPGQDPPQDPPEDPPEDPPNDPPEDPPEDPPQNPPEDPPESPPGSENGNNDNYDNQQYHSLVKALKSLQTGKDVKLPAFSGSDQKGKGEVSFNEWKRRYIALKKRCTCTEEDLKTAIRNSLGGEAEEYINGQPQGLTSKEIVRRLEICYGDVEETRTLLVRYLETTQREGEDLGKFAVRLEILLNRVIEKGGVPEEERDGHLRGQLWSGMVNEQLKQAMHHHYENEDLEFHDLVEVVRLEDERRKTSKKLRSQTKARSHSQSASLKSSSKAEPGYADLMKMMKNMQTEMTAIKKSLNQEGAAGSYKGSKPLNCQAPPQGDRR